MRNISSEGDIDSDDTNTSSVIHALKVILYPVLTHTFACRKHDQA